MPYISQDQADIAFSVMNRDGVMVPFFGDWFSVEGAGLDSNDSKQRAGGMGAETALGGSATRDDATLQIPLDDNVLAHHATLEARVQERAPCQIGVQYLNRLKAAYPTGRLITGVIKSAKLPDSDGGSSDGGMYEVVVSCDEQAGAG
jgi:hypothetical protein